MVFASRWGKLVQDLLHFPVTCQPAEFCSNLSSCLHEAGLPLVLFAFRSAENPESIFSASAGLKASPDPLVVAQLLAIAQTTKGPRHLIREDQWACWPGSVSWGEAGATSVLGFPLCIEGEGTGCLALGFPEAPSAGLAEAAEMIAGQVGILLRLHLAEFRADDGMAFYKAIFDNAMDAIFLTSPDGAIHAANPAAYAMLGRKEGARAPLQRDEVLDKSDPRLLSALLQREATGRFAGELNFRRADGSVFPVELTSTLFSGYQGTRHGVIVARDISRRRGAENALIAQEATLRNLFNSSSFLLGIVELEDGDIRLIAANDASARFFGRPVQEIRGRLLSDLGVSQQAMQFWLENYERSRRDNRSVHFDYEQVQSGGGRWLSVTVGYVGPGRNGSNRYSYAAEDISERKEAEARAAQLSQMYLALSKTNRAVAFRLDRGALLNEVCRIATECSGFIAASIAMVDQVTGTADLVAYSGKLDEYETLLKLHAVHPLRRKECRKWQAVREGRPYVCNDWERDASASCPEARLFGTLRSSAVFPLFVENKVVAAFSVFSDSSDVFHDRRLDVLKEMASVLSFGLESLEGEQRRRSAEEALRKSEEQLRRLLDTCQEGVWIIDQDACTTYMNARMGHLLGYSLEETHGKPLYDFMADEWISRAHQKIARRMEGVSEIYDFCFRRRDGSELWAIVSTNPITGEAGGGIVGSIAMVTDITARKLAENALRESEEKFRVITEAAADAIIMMDGERRVSFWNRAAEQIFGYSAQEALGQGMHSLIAQPQDRELAGVGMPDFLRRGSGPILDATRELVAMRKGGELFPIELSVSAVRTKGGWNAVGIVRDITVRKQAETALRESQDMLSRVMDLVPLVIYLHDVDSSRTLYVNRAVETATGFSPDEIKAKQSHFISALAHPEDLFSLATLPERWQAAAEGETIEYDCRLSTSDGIQRYMSMREVVVSRDADGRPQQILGVAKDITARVWQQLVEAQKLADFARMGRLVTMGEMASALAHELNQPLAAITNFTQACLNLLRKGETDTRELELGLEKTVAQALRAGSVLQTVREFVRKRDANPRSLDINKAIVEMVELARIRSRNQNIAYSLLLDHSLPRVWADRILVDQVVMNLLRNAEEALEGCSEPVIEIEVNVGEEGFLVVSVRDYGRGLPRDFDLGKLPAFYSTKSDGMGVGLGICRSIVEASGGRIWAEPVLPRGSVFRFTLTVASADECVH